MEIINFKLKVGDPKIFATFDVFLGMNSTITYPNFRLKYGKNGGYFVSRPSYIRSEDEYGNKIFGNYPEMSPEKWKSLSGQLNELLKPFLPKSPEKSAFIPTDQGSFSEDPPF